MQLSLDHHQRLNLTVLLGQLECTSLTETRAAWKLIDQISLDDQEKQSIDFTVHNNNGNEAYSWNPEKKLPMREYDISEADLKQIQRALNSCPRFYPSQVRRWLEPLLTQLPEAESISNVRATSA